VLNRVGRNGYGIFVEKLYEEEHLEDEESNGTLRA
jgi:hypothetical protein